MSDITMYGTPTCKDCVIAKMVFDELGTEYEFRNMVEDQEATEIAIKLNNGVRRIPVIQFPDGSILVEPSYDELKTKMTSF
tara:strand:- start:55 stop:297 length:243 start_codon:yes stop_codon:yes gene_type:complete